MWFLNPGIFLMVSAAGEHRSAPSLAQCALMLRDGPRLPWKLSAHSFKVCSSGHAHIHRAHAEPDRKATAQSKRTRPSEVGEVVSIQGILTLPRDAYRGAAFPPGLTHPAAR